MLCCNDVMYIVDERVSQLQLSREIVKVRFDFSLSGIEAYLLQ
jgi:hypothetical protein